MSHYQLSTPTNTVYTHPTSSGYKHIPSGGSAGQILRWSSDGTAVWGSDNNTTYGTGTSTASGLTKLYTGTGSATDGTMTQSAITSALNNLLVDGLHTYIGVEMRIPNTTDTSLANLICRLRDRGYFFGRFAAMSFPELPVQSWGYLVQFFLFK